MSGVIREFRHCAGMVCICLLMSGGCFESESLIQVTGRITVGGRPARGASVRCYPLAPNSKGFPASGTVSDDGSYSLSTRGASGIPPGRYRVTIVWPDPSVQFSQQQIEEGASPNDAPDLLKGEYASPQKSPLVVEVTRQTRELPPIEL